MHMEDTISFYCDDYEQLSVESLGLGLSHRPLTHTGLYNEEAFCDLQESFSG